MAYKLKKLFSRRRSSLVQPNSSDDDSAESIGTPSVTRFFADAALYKKAIADPHGPQLPHGTEYSGHGSVEDFAELVGGDLSSPEKLLAGRFAQLSTGLWDSDGDDLSASNEKPVLSREEPSSDVLQNQPLWAISESEGVQVSTEAISPVEPTSTLSPEDVITLLKREFGELDIGGPPERLLLETDGALVQDVIIVGVIHVTTHRIAFHASLLSSRPDLFPSRPILKAGPALIRRKGLHRNRRVWLELSHDFISTYPSASEEDHIRPFRSVMLTSIREVYAEDPQQPRVIRARVDGPPGLREAMIEFDTLESARDWRREFEGALFLLRHRMRSTLLNSTPEELDGVRVTIPLDRITHHTHRHQADHVHFVSLYLAPSESRGESSKNTAAASDGYSPELPMVQFAVTRFDKTWAELHTIIRNSKLFSRTDDGATEGAPVIVDFGRDFNRAAPAEADGPADRNKERAVCDMLAIDYSPDVWVVRARLYLSFATSGFLVVSRDWLGFWSKSIAMDDVQYRLQTSSIRSVTPVAPRICGQLISALQMEIEGHAGLRFQFRSDSIRNETMQRIRDVAGIDGMKGVDFSRIDSSRRSPRTPSRSNSATFVISPISRTLTRVAKGQIPKDIAMQLPKAINLPRGLVLRIPPTHFVCLTIGSRGDVQPYIALALGLKQDGHRITIVTHEEYKSWVEGFGIGHRTAGGDPGALMKLSVENKMFSPHFFKESLVTYRSWLDKLLLDSWAQCHDAEVLLESPYAMGGVHIAEALNVPYFRASTMPWTKTTQFPHPFISPPVETPTFNIISYILFDNVFWAATSSQINQWRQEVLNLGPTDMSHLAQSKIPILYNFSPSVVPKPLDWNDLVTVSGYWFLDNPDHDWNPPQTLMKWMQKARSSGRPIVYIGFGSITVPNPHAMTQNIIQAVLKSNMRAIISKGWSSRMSQDAEPDIEIPDECYVVTFPLPQPFAHRYRDHWKGTIC